MARTTLLISFIVLLAGADALRIPIRRVEDRRERRSSFSRRSRQRRDTVNSTVNVIDAQNAIYIGAITIGGTLYDVQLDTGSSDLWIQGNPPNTQGLGVQASISYAIGNAAGEVSTAPVSFAGYNITNQAYLEVPTNATFSGGLFTTGASGILGLGPSKSSVIRNKLGNATGDSVVDRIFVQDPSTPNFISFLLGRLGDGGSPIKGQFTVGDVVPGYENITSQAKLPVNVLPSSLAGDQHWTTIVDSVIGPDANIIPYSSSVSGTPSGKLVAVLDSGFTLPQVPRDVSDAIYGRVQGAEYDSVNQWWTVPCGQLLNISFVLGGVTFPVHPLDTVSSDFNIANSSGKAMCLGTFQPITSAFSLNNEYDMILGDGFLRNAYTLLNYGDFVDFNTSNTASPYAQLLPLTVPSAAHADFISTRLGGTDTTSSPQYTLLPSSQEQHSPEATSEIVQHAESYVLRYLPAIIIGSVAVLLIIVGLCVWRCCCSSRRRRGNAGKGSIIPPTRGTYRPLGEPAPPAVQLQPLRVSYMDEPQAFKSVGMATGGYVDPYYHAGR